MSRSGPSESPAGRMARPGSAFFRPLYGQEVPVDVRWATRSVRVRRSSLRPRVR